MVDKPYMRVGLYIFAALLLFVSGVTHKQSPTLSVSRQVMSLRGMESSKASVATDIKIRPLRRQSKFLSLDDGTKGSPERKRVIGSPLL